MDQRSYSNFFTISTVLGLPSNSLCKIEANDTLPFLDVLVMKWGKKADHESVPEACSY
jgi:hypothetical protein